MATLEREAGTKHQTTAVLLADAPVGTSTTELRNVEVPARWYTPDGAPRVGDVSTYRGMAQGTEIAVWVDDAGDLTSPPATPAGAITDGVSVGVSAWLAVVGLCGLVYAGFRALLARARSVYWEREWERVEREWTRR
ncbi:hypothetical protein ACFSVJ_02045 [Prauserella oleivorans]